MIAFALEDIGVVVKATGGGPRVKNKNSPILLYVVALLMAFLKWAHFPLNSQRLPRYESPKIRCFHTFSTFSIGKEIEPQFKFSKCLIALHASLTTKFGQ